MPISCIDHLPAIANEIYRLQPHTVLDLGVGFGLYGAVARQMLDAMHGRCARGQWQADIYGVEAHSAYRNSAWGCYNNVLEIDFTGCLDQSRNWDLILMIDSIEHVPPQDGAKLLNYLVEHNRHVIVSVPVVPMPQGAMYGNEYETHRTHHDGTEFERFNPVTLYKGMTQVFSIKGKL